LNAATQSIGQDRPSVGIALREAALHLRALPHAAPRLEAELLLAEATGLTRERLVAWPELALESAAYTRFRGLLERRLGGEPIAYIRDRQAFWDLELRVTPDTLIPRPETELLVQLALERLPADAPLILADVGTGSGAIAAALARERPGWTLVAIEREADTVRVAADNLHRHAPDNAVLVRADWLAACGRRSLDAVIGNPPYVREQDPHLARGDLPFEPRGALTAGRDGLDAIRRIARESAYCLRPGGLLVLEQGYDQGPEVRAILAAAGFRDISTRPDLSGLERATLGRC